MDLLEPQVLEKVDMLLRQRVREICGLPADTPLPVYYTDRKYRGPGMLRVVWETSLHFSIAKTLSRVNDVHFHAIREIIIYLMSQCEQHVMN